MGNWQLEVAKMGLYMAFPVASFYAYHQVRLYITIRGHITELDNFYSTFFTLYILPNSLNIIGKIAFLPITLCFHDIFFPIAMIFPSPLHNLIFFSQQTPTKETLYTPVKKEIKISINSKSKTVYQILAGY